MGRQRIDWRWREEEEGAFEKAAAGGRGAEGAAASAKCVCSCARALRERANGETERESPPEEQGERRPDMDRCEYIQGGGTKSLSHDQIIFLATILFRGFLGRERKDDRLL